MTTRIKDRRDTAANWTSINPVLGAGEHGYEIGTGKEKIGNGTSAWAALPYRSDDSSNSSTYASYVNLAKNPDTLIAGAVAVDSSNFVTSAAVVWPDGSAGILTITSRDATGAVLGYNITYGSPVTKTYTQPTITRNAAGAATNVPQIVVS